MKSFQELKKLEPGLEYLGIRNIKKAHWNLSSPKLYEQAAKRGEGIMSHLFKEYRPDSGDIRTRHTGTLISMEKGEAMTYSLNNIETRGRLFIGPGDAVYEGMIIGENPRVDDLPVNPTKAKHITNHRASGSDKTVALTPPIRFSLERAIEYIAPDELVEATPKNIRLRKRILDSNERKRQSKKIVNN